MPVLTSNRISEYEEVLAFAQSELKSDMQNLVIMKKNLFLTQTEISHLENEIRLLEAGVDRYQEYIKKMKANAQSN